MTQRRIGDLADLRSCGSMCEYRYVCTGKGKGTEMWEYFFECRSLNKFSKAADHHLIMKHEMSATARGRENQRITSKCISKPGAPFFIHTTAADSHP